MPNTIGEGVPIVGNSQAYNTTPPPVMFSPPQPPVGSKPFITVLSIIFGTILSAGTIVGVLGKAFYVERAEYTKDKIEIVTERVAVSKALENISKSMASLEASYDQLSKKIDYLKDHQREGRTR